MFGYGKTYYIDELAKNEQLLGLSKKYDLSFDEAIEAMKLNHRKLEPVLNYDQKLVGFKRK